MVLASLKHWSVPMLGLKRLKVMVVLTEVIESKFSTCTTESGVRPPSHIHCPIPFFGMLRATSKENTVADLSRNCFIGTELINIGNSDLFQNYLMAIPTAKG
jgi:hypothetical protein